MFKSIFISAWFYIPAALIALLTFGLCVLWRQRLYRGRNTQVIYPLETLRSPIDVAVSSAGILVPLIAGLIAFLASEGVGAAQLAPLGVSLLFMVFGVLVGLFNLFGMTSSVDDKVTLDKKNLTYMVPIVVLQFLLTAASLAVLLIYFVARFDMPRPDGKELARTPAHETSLRRPIVRAGQTAADARSQWGAPSRIDKQSTAEIWHYPGPSTDFELVVENGTVQRVTEKAH